MMHVGYKVVRAPRTRRRMRGGGKGRVVKWLKTNLPKVNSFLKRTKLISRLGSAALSSGGVPMQYAPFVSKGVSLAQKLGYGRRQKRVYRGRGLRLAGGALRLSGARYY